MSPNRPARLSNRDCFSFMIGFYKNILILPEEFIVDKNSFDVANFSFDLGQETTKTSKRDYIKYSLLNFFMRNESLFIEFQLENKLFEIIELYEQKQIEKEKDIRNRKEEEKEDLMRAIPEEEGKRREIEGLASYHKGTLKECIQNINAMIGPKESNVFLKSSGEEARLVKGLKVSPENVRFLLYLFGKL